MKKISTCLFIAISFFSVSCLAQGGKQNMEEVKRTLKDSLKLSDAQADSVVAIRAEFQPRIRSIMKDESLSKSQKKEKVKPIKKEMVTRLKGFLDDEQIGKLEAMEQDMRKKGGGGKGSKDSTQ